MLTEGKIKTSLFHQGFTLIGRSSMTFAILLLFFYSTSFWFKFNAAHFGLIAVLFSLLFTHCFLIALESRPAALIFWLLLKGKPIVVYRYWLAIDDQTIKFGLNRLLWQAIEGVSLSPFGNLIFTSRALCGPAILENGKDNNPASQVLKVPFAAINLSQQKQFIALLKEKCPQATLGSTLAAISNKPILKSTSVIHALTIIIFFIVLSDVGYSTFSYIELLKRYYLCIKSVATSSLPDAQEYYASAEWLRTHPPLFSFVSPKLLNNSSAAATLLETRSRALWSLGRTIEAVNVQAEAVKLIPKSFKISLRQARLCWALGRPEEAQKVVQDLIERHKHALLPRLYVASLLWRTNKTKQAKLFIKDYLSLLNDEYFLPPPVWPSGNDEYLHELFYREDLDFFFPERDLSK